MLVKEKRMEMAVSIAKDVLKNLKLMNVEAGKQYVSSQTMRVPISSKQIQKDVSKLRKECQVCALGACFLSYVKLYNESTYEEVNRGWLDRTIDFNYYALTNKLKKIFSPKQLAIIEYIFENEKTFRISKTTKCLTNIEQSKYSVFYNETLEMFATSRSNLSKDQFVLKKIMENIVQNNGRFVLSRKSKVLEQAT